MREVKYYELEFKTGVSGITSSMCVLGYRKPTIEEAKEFWKADCELYDDEELFNVREISKEQAHEEFDMENEANFPIFGADSEVKTFYISVTETLNRVVAVEAEDLDEAFEKIEEACNAGIVDLTSKDFVRREFENETDVTEELITDGISRASDYLKIN